MPSPARQMTTTSYAQAPVSAAAAVNVLFADGSMTADATLRAHRCCRRRRTRCRPTTLALALVLAVLSWSLLVIGTAAAAADSRTQPPPPRGRQHSTTHRTSRACAFYEQQVAHEYIARMHAYAPLTEHEQHVSQMLEPLLTGAWYESINSGIAIAQRSQFARDAPSDFVVLRLFSCSCFGTTAIHDSRMELLCHPADAVLLDAAHVARIDALQQIRHFSINQKYREVALFANPPPKSTPKEHRSKHTHKPKALTAELGVQALWDRGITGAGVRIGVFDTGLSTTRIQHVKERINWTHEKKNDDAVGHGTFVAGVISGTDAECPGIAPDAELYVFRMFTTEQLSFTSWFLDAFNYALFRNLHVLNLSTGGPDFRDQPFVDKIQELAANGITVVSAVGNSGPKYGTLTNPADQMEVIGVGGVTRDSDVADFSSRGMTTWELPFGAGRVKPDVVTLAEAIPGFDGARGCTLLSGTSVSAPIVTGAIALLASMVPPAHRWHLLNPASIKQILIASADRLVARPADTHDYVVHNHIFEQGSGQLNITRASEHVLALWTRFEQAQAVSTNSSDSDAVATAVVDTQHFTPTAYPSSIDATDCPYMWPLCSQPLYVSSLPLMVNLTILNPGSVAGVLDSTPQWLADTDADTNSDVLTVSVATPAVLWPFVGSVGVFVEVAAHARTFNGVARGSLVLTVRNGMRVDRVVVPITVAVIPTPIPAKRILWDQFHNIPYPSAFVPRDKLENRYDLLDAAGDHPHTNFHQLWNFLILEGYFVEILPFEYSCLDLALYGVVLLVDPEESYFTEEVVALQRALRYANVSLLVFADWYDDDVLDAMELFDTSTLSKWHAVTGGANVPALNALLRDFSIEFGTGAVSNPSITLLANGNDTNPAFPFWSGTYLTKFPVGGYLGRIDGVDQSAMVLNQSDVALTNVPVLGLYQVPSKHGGRIAVYGDSSCIDASVHGTNSGFRDCFAMVRALLRFTNDGVLPDTEVRYQPVATTTAPYMRHESGGMTHSASPQLEYLDVEFSGTLQSSRRRLVDGNGDAALELRTPMLAPSTAVDRQAVGRAELYKHSKVLRASAATPQRQSFCHFYHRQECSKATRVMIAEATRMPNVQIVNGTLRH